jgi:hypothetical protein
MKLWKELIRLLSVEGQPTKAFLLQAYTNARLPNLTTSIFSSVKL